MRHKSIDAESLKIDTKIEKRYGMKNIAYSTHSQTTSTKPTQHIYSAIQWLHSEQTNDYQVEQIQTV